MSEPTRFKRGDRVRHPERPEWGQGKVESAQDQTLQGKPSQRVVVTFANHGRVTLNTAFAPLTPLDERGWGGESTTGAGQSTGGRAGGGWLAQLEKQQATGNGKPTHDLAELPEPATDPFRSLIARLKSTLELYRFDDGARGLIDWAVAQSGMNDPLAEFSRHELEQQFAAFAQARDAHLRELLITIRRKGEEAAVKQLSSELPPQLQSVLDKARARL